MKLTLLCNCGLLFTAQGQSLLVDAPNEMPCPPFYALPEPDFAALSARQGDFSSLQVLVFTHAHADHYSPARVRACAQGLPVLLPQRQDAPPQSFRFGVFTVELQPIAHTPLPHAALPPNAAVIVEAEGRRVYLGGDADIDVAAHERAMQGRRFDAAFWNGQFLSYPQTRALLHAASSRNYIYHIPVDERDVSGIRRKCRRNLQRFAQELSGVVLLEQYPAEIAL